MKTSLHQYFSQLPDPRIHRNKKHLLIDIIVLSVIAIICGAESWNSIELFGNSKKDFLSKILKLPNGIPSHDTINRVFSLISPDKFEQLFSQWVQSLIDTKISGEVIAVDGKSMRGSKDSYHNKSPVHIVSAWANSNQLVLGQIRTNEKSNEITAIPELLDLLDIEGCIITIDAMGTQKKIAETIIEKQANYILALKGNQGYLKEDVRNTFLRQQPDSMDETVEKGHGRLETRKCEVINKLDFLDEKEQWAGLRSLARVTAKREINGKQTSEERLYISSVESDAKSFNLFIRQHWGVENSLHWTLDVTFREDAQRKRNGHAAGNFALVEKSNDKLLTAIRIAIAGNVIDFGVGKNFNIREEIDKTLKKDFAIFDYDKFRDYLDKTDEILYLGDNAGESVFDRILIEEMKRPVIYVVREIPVINDVTYKDAIQAGIDKVASILSSGTSAPGTVLGTCNDEFKELYKNSKFVISKGQGNYEGLSEEKRSIFFLLKAKCRIIANDIGVREGDIVLKGINI